MQMMQLPPPPPPPDDRPPPKTPPNQGVTMPWPFPHQHIAPSAKPKSPGEQMPVILPSPGLPPPPPPAPPPGIHTSVPTTYPGDNNSGTMQHTTAGQLLSQITDYDYEEVPIYIPQPFLPLGSTAELDVQDDDDMPAVGPGERSRSPHRGVEERPYRDPDDGREEVRIALRDILTPESGRSRSSRGGHGGLLG